MKGLIITILGCLLFMVCQNAMGQEIVFSSSRSGSWELWIMDDRGNRQRQITKTLEDERSPAWSPDRKNIAYATNADGIYVMGRDGKKGMHLAKSLGRCDHPVWHPDGKRLAFVSFQYAKGEDSDLYVINMNDSKDLKPKKLVALERMEMFPAWSPDGNRLVYSLFRRGRLQEVVEDLWMRDMLVNTDRPLIQAGKQVFHADWSPDGRSLVFASDLTGDYELWLFNLKPMSLDRLTHKPGFDGDPCWSPNGENIAFVSTRSGNKQIWVMDRDGTHLRQLTKGPAESKDPDW